jgi:hypothetical protein
LPVFFVALQFLSQHQENLWVMDTEISDSLELFRFQRESSKPVRSMHMAWETSVQDSTGKSFEAEPAASRAIRGIPRNHSPRRV